MSIPSNVLIDDGDIPLVLEYSQRRKLDWRIVSDGNDRLYVLCGEVLLHRFLMGVTAPKIFVHHKNNNGLDNRRNNLECVTQQQNNQRTRSVRYDNGSGKTGVGYHKGSKSWCARITINRKTIALGSFPTFEQAKTARLVAEIKYFGVPTNV